MGIVFGETNLIGKSGNIVEVSDSNELKVIVSTNSETPETKTGFTVQTALNDLNVSGNSTDETYYTIPTGETITIQTLRASCERSSGGSKVVLYYQPNGNTTNEELLSIVYLNGSNFIDNIEWTAPEVGNGTRRLRISRTRLDFGTREIYFKLRGYY